jgi:hypothetical protein
MLKQTRVPLRKYIARKGLFIRVPIPKKLKGLEPEIALGRAILDRALLDCLDDPDIIDWFDTSNPDFNTICFISYLEPNLVFSRFETTLKRLQNKEFIQVILRELDEDEQ